MQCDLMDLRDAHAKLRTINEKLRKEKDKMEQECESLRLCNVRMRTDPQVEVKIGHLSQLMKSLNMTLKENSESTIKSVNTLNAPTPPARRKSSISREASPDSSLNPVSNINDNDQIKQLLNKVNDITKELVSCTSQQDVKSKRLIFNVRYKKSLPLNFSNAHSVKRFTFLDLHQLKMMFRINLH